MRAHQKESQDYGAVPDKLYNSRTPSLCYTMEQTKTQQQFYTPYPSSTFPPQQKMTHDFKQPATKGDAVVTGFLSCVVGTCFTPICGLAVMLCYSDNISRADVLAGYSTSLAAWAIFWFVLGKSNKYKQESKIILCRLYIAFLAILFGLASWRMFSRESANRQQLEVV